jgi:hypothetical protein
MTKKITLRTSDRIATNFAGFDVVIIYQIPKVLTNPTSKGHIDIIISGYLQADYRIV